MTGGLFANRTVNRGRPAKTGWMAAHQAYFAGRRIEGARNRENLAEAMAEGAPTVSAAAKLIGISQQAASRHWRAICDGLGRQAR